MINSAIVLHIDEFGFHSIRQFGGEPVAVLWVDENCKGDRVYLQDTVIEPVEALLDLIGNDTIGNSSDGYLDQGTIQAIRAVIWKQTGGSLTEITS